MKTNYDYLIGKKIKITNMEGEWNYIGREGIVENISGGGSLGYQLHGTWGGLAVLLGVDSYEVIE